MDGETNPPQNEYFDQNRRGGGCGSSESSSKGRRNKPYGNHNQSQSNDHYGSSSSGADQSNTNHYTLADVPRLAEYSASVYASNMAEHDHFYKYYTDYYINEINQGNFAGLPTINQIGGTANSGAAVALSAIQRQQKLQHRDFSVVAAAVESQASCSSSTTVPNQPLVLPNGRDNKKYRKYFLLVLRMY